MGMMPMTVLMRVGRLLLFDNSLAAHATEKLFQEVFGGLMVWLRNSIGRYLDFSVVENLNENRVSIFHL